MTISWRLSGTRCMQHAACRPLQMQWPFLILVANAHGDLSACRCHLLPWALSKCQRATREPETKTAAQIKTERKRERERDGESKLEEPRCHSHLRRVNYVLFIIMRSTHALTTFVTNANNWRIESCRHRTRFLWASPGRPILCPVAAFHMRFCDYSRFIFLTWLRVL